MDQSPDEDVAAAFSSGQPDVLALVYQRFGALVYSIALRSLRARSDAEDVTQQVFVSAWQSRSSFNRGRGTLGGWLVTITRNKVVDALRERTAPARPDSSTRSGRSSPSDEPTPTGCHYRASGVTAESRRSGISPLLRPPPARSSPNVSGNNPGRSVERARSLTRPRG
jgi:RNA polymerase sigma factor (sigma-70 family)